MKNLESPKKSPDVLFGSQPADIKQKAAPFRNPEFATERRRGGAVRLKNVRVHPKVDAFHPFDAPAAQKRRQYRAWNECAFEQVVERPT